MMGTLTLPCVTVLDSCRKAHRVKSTANVMIAWCVLNPESHRSSISQSTHAGKWQAELIRRPFIGRCGGVGGEGVNAVGNRRQVVLLRKLKIVIAYWRVPSRPRDASAVNPILRVNAFVRGWHIHITRRRHSVKIRWIRCIVCRSSSLYSDAERCEYGNLLIRIGRSTVFGCRVGCAEFP